MDNKQSEEQAVHDLSSPPNPQKQEPPEQSNQSIKAISPFEQQQLPSIQPLLQTESLSQNQHKDPNHISIQHPQSALLQGNIANVLPPAPQILTPQQQQPQQQQLQQQQLQQLSANPQSNDPAGPALAPQPLLQTISSGQMSSSDHRAQQKQQVSPSKSQVTKVKLTDELNLFDWSRATEIINQIAEKAKSSVDSVITVLDPGMKEYLYSGGDVNILTICDKLSHIGPIRDAFQYVFGRATVTVASNTQHESASHPIKLAFGFNEAISIGRERIKRLRSNTSIIPQNQVVVALQPTLICVESQNESYEKTSGTADQTEVTDKTNDISKFHQTSNYFFIYAIVIEDPVLGAAPYCFSQSIPIDQAIVIDKLSQYKSPHDKKDDHLGFSKSIHEIMNEALQIQEPNDEQEEQVSWIKLVSGLDEATLVHDLGILLAHSYRCRWNSCMSRS